MPAGAGPQAALYGQLGRAPINNRTKMMSRIVPNDMCCLLNLAQPSIYRLSHLTGWRVRIFPVGPLLAEEKILALN